MKNRTRIAKSGLFFVIVLALLLGITGVVLAEGSYINIPLNNDTAGEGTDCPVDGGAYWHFVISPNNNESYFITFHLNLGDATTYDTSVFVPNGDQMDNIFLPVPSGKMLASLIKEGSSADIYWSGEGTEPAKFQLSHVCGGPKDLTVSKTAEPSFTRTFDWDIDKSADKDKVYSVGGAESEPVEFTVTLTKDAGTDSEWAVSGVITVHNPNTFDVYGVSLSDSTPGGTCNVDPATVDVPAGGDAMADYVCTFTENPLSGTNTATATWTDFGSPNTSADGTADYTFGDPTTLVNDEVDVTDTNGKTWHFSDSGYVTYTMTYEDPAGVCTSHDNTVTIDQTSAYDTATVEDCQGADLTVSKTAIPSFDRTYAWTIMKDVDYTFMEVVPGDKATFNYSVTVSHDAGTDSNWAISGIITVTNPNVWQDVVVDVTDDLCTVIGGEDVTVPADGKVDIPYSCTVDATATLNTATATWDAAAYYTPNGSATGSAPFSFVTPTTLIDECIDVTDSVYGAFGTVCVGDTNPYVFNYSVSYDAPPLGTCVTYDNTASFITNDTGATGSDSETVEICTWNARLTPGYWKNHLEFNPLNPLKPYVAAYLPITLGGWDVNTTNKATKVFKEMNCSSNSKLDAVGCLAGHLLAAKLNVANMANPFIQPVIDEADAFLLSIGYSGPNGTYTLTKAQRIYAIMLKDQLDAYNKMK